MAVTKRNGSETIVWDLDSIEHDGEELEEVVLYCCSIGTRQCHIG